MMGQGRFGHILAGALTAAALLGLAAPATAAPVTFSYTGDVTLASGIFAGQGGTVTGTFTFDDGLLDSIAGNTLDRFRNDFPAANQALSSSFGATLTVGSVAVSEGTTNPTPVDAYVDLLDSSGQDRFVFELRKLSASESSVLLMAADVGGTPDGVHAGTGNLTDSAVDAIALIDGLDLSLFNNVVGQSTWQEYDDSGAFLGGIDFTLTGISLATATVSEPGAAGLLVLALAGLGAAQRRRSRTT